jgi:hypothetical protein
MEKLTAAATDANAKRSTIFPLMEHMISSACVNILSKSTIETLKYVKSKNVNVMCLPVPGHVHVGKNMTNIRQFRKHLSRGKNKGSKRTT